MAASLRSWRGKSSTSFFLEYWKESIVCIDWYTLRCTAGHFYHVPKHGSFISHEAYIRRDIPWQAHPADVSTDKGTITFSSLELGPFREAASLAYGQVVLHLLWNPNIYLHPLESILSHFNQVDTFTLFFLKSWGWTSGFRFLTESGSLFLPHHLL